MLLIALPVASVVAMAVTTVILLPVIVGVIVTLMTEMLHAPLMRATLSRRLAVTVTTTSLCHPQQNRAAQPSHPAAA